MRLMICICVLMISASQSIANRIVSKQTFSLGNGNSLVYTIVDIGSVDHEEGFLTAFRGKLKIFPDANSTAEFSTGIGAFVLADVMPKYPGKEIIVMDGDWRSDTNWRTDKQFWSGASGLGIRYFTLTWFGYDPKLKRYVQFRESSSIDPMDTSACEKLVSHKLFRHFVHSRSYSFVRDAINFFHQDRPDKFIEWIEDMDEFHLMGNCVRIIRVHMIGVNGDYIVSWYRDGSPMEHGGGNVVE